MMNSYYVLSLMAFCALLSSCGSYRQIGDLTVMANRNVGDPGQYELLQRDVKVIILAQANGLDVALDEATQKVHGGEYMQNVRIYIKDNGARIKLIGDVWGIARRDFDGDRINEIMVGDDVSYKVGSVLRYGRVLGFNGDIAIVEYETSSGHFRTKEIPVEELFLLGVDY